MPLPKHTASEVLQNQWWVGAVAFVVSLIATPAVRAIAYRLKVVDRPDHLLKPHGRPVAYLGGVAMCLGLLGGLAVFVFHMPDLGQQWARLGADLSSGRFGAVLDNTLWKATSIVLASVVIVTVGLLDDVRDIKPRQKVAGQMAAACILLVGGVGHRMALVFLGFWTFSPPGWILLPLSAVMCLVAVIAACNATNLLDGLDGLCGGVTGIISLGFLALAVWLAQWGRFAGTDELRIGLCLAMAGAVFGFLPYNIPPATIFMGDAGSMLLGFFVATMMALFCQEGSTRWFTAALVVFALPILDTGLAVVRRVLSGKSIFHGDRSHLYDQLVDRGMKVKQVVVLFYFLALVAAAVGVGAAIFLRARYAILIYAVLLAGVWVAFWKLGMIRPEPRHPEPDEPEAPDPGA